MIEELVEPADGCWPCLPFLFRVADYFHAYVQIRQRHRRVRYFVSRFCKHLTGDLPHIMQGEGPHPRMV